MAKLTEDQKTRIVELYVSGESTVRIAQRFQVSASTIGHLLNRRNAALRSRRGNSTKCQLRQDAFDELTPDAAYWIGFLFADGSVSRRGESAEVQVRRLHAWGGLRHGHDLRSAELEELAEVAVNHSRYPNVSLEGNSIPARCR